MRKQRVRRYLKTKQIKAINELLTFNYLTLLIDFANKFVYILKRSSNFEIVNLLSIELSFKICDGDGEVILQHWETT